MKSFVYVLLCSFVLIGTMGCKGDGSSGLETGWYYIVDVEKENAEGTIAKKIFNSKDDKVYHLNPESIITVTNINKIEESVVFGDKKVIRMTFDDEGRQKWEDATAKYVQKYFGFILNNELLVIRRIATKSKAGAAAVNRPDYSEEELEKLLKEMQALLPEKEMPVEKK